MTSRSQAIYFAPRSKIITKHHINQKSLYSIPLKSINTRTTPISFSFSTISPLSDQSPPLKIPPQCKYPPPIIPSPLQPSYTPSLPSNYHITNTKRGDSCLLHSTHASQFSPPKKVKNMVVRAHYKKSCPDALLACSPIQIHSIRSLPSSIEETNKEIRLRRIKKK
jgi:hypothetical protein